MQWELAQTITHHLAGPDARLLQINLQDLHLEVLVPHTNVIHHIIIEPDTATLVMPINSMYSHTVASCTITKEFEIILN